MVKPNRKSIVLSMSILLLAGAVLVSRVLTGSALGVELPQVDLAEWTPADIRTLGEDPFGKLVTATR